MVGGFAEAVGVVATTVDALMSRRMRAALSPALAAVCLLGTLLSYYFGNRPVNSKVADWTPVTLPPDWDSYRQSWETSHTVSAVFGAVAFLVLLAATIFARHGIAPTEASTSSPLAG